MCGGEAELLDGRFALREILVGRQNGDFAGGIIAWLRVTIALMPPSAFTAKC